MSVESLDVQACNVIAFPVQGRTLGRADHVFVQSAIADIAQEWSVELQGLCAEDTTLVLIPDGGDDAAGPSFVICREACGFRLGQVHWDAVTEIGAFSSLVDVVKAVRSQLSPYLQTPSPVVTFH